MITDDSEQSALLRVNDKSPGSRKTIIAAVGAIIVVAVVVVTVVLVTMDDGDDGVVQQPQKRAVVMISVDGFRHDYLELHGAPNIQRIANEGFRVKQLKPVFISKTFPNHYTLVTGMYAESHGIVSNTMYDPELGYFSIRDSNAVTNGKWWDAAEPIWVTAERQARKAACYFWPGSEAEIKGFRPSYYEKYDESVPYDERVQTVLDWLDLPSESRPDIILTYFEIVDTNGHIYGPNTQQVKDGLKIVDDAIGQLVDGLKARGIYDHVDLLIMADHGMTQMQPDTQVIKLNDYIDLNRVEVVDRSIIPSIKPKNMADLAETFANLTNAHPNMTCWLKEDIPAKYHYQNNVRIQPIICRCDPGFAAIRGNGDSDNDQGSHGFDNDFLDMHGTMVGRGPSLRKSYTRNEILENIHVYELVSKIMGLAPAPNNGTLASVADLFAI
eukprot:TRINITY_DN534_c1_g2_i1.p1 TRINITY_DN534_c1_g2~~TRINITY_DN534_c1_g2_i1.p1  ORF type:complete len:441 (-),score=100.85 TRINITY_DN534_c1_g2_i1:245-1567(-)